jgi:hypothetical protein
MVRPPNGDAVIRGAAVTSGRRDASAGNRRVGGTRPQNLKCSITRPTAVPPTVTKRNTTNVTRNPGVGNRRGTCTGGKEPEDIRPVRGMSVHGRKNRGGGTPENRGRGG